MKKNSKEFYSQFLMRHGENSKPMSKMNDEIRKTIVTDE